MAQEFRQIIAFRHHSFIIAVFRIAFLSGFFVAANHL
jgi:hypothetical protein